MFATCRPSPSSRLVLGYPLQFTFNGLKCLFLARFATHPFTPHVFRVTAASEGEARHFGGGEQLSPPKTCWGDPRGARCPPGMASSPTSPLPSQIYWLKAKINKYKSGGGVGWPQLGCVSAGGELLGGTRRGSGDEPRLGRAHKSHVFDPRGRTEAALRSAGPAGGELPRRSPGRSPARAGSGGFLSVAASLAGEHLVSRCEFGVLEASWLGRGCKSAGGHERLAARRRPRAGSPLPVSQAALGLPSESGFVWRLPAGNAAGSAGCPTAAGFLQAPWLFHRRCSPREAGRARTSLPSRSSAELLCSRASLKVAGDLFVPPLTTSLP